MRMLIQVNQADMRQNLRLIVPRYTILSADMCQVQNTAPFKMLVKSNFINHRNTMDVLIICLGQE